MTGASPTIRRDSVTFSEAEPRLSILIPFFCYDPTPLVAALAEQARRLDPHQIEIILLDDGGGDIALSHAVCEMILSLDMPARLITLGENQGRSMGRNILFGDARGGHLLFIDCDMAPDHPNFLRNWIELIETRNPAVAFGGFSLKQAQPGPEHDLHVALQLRGECVGAVVRRQTPEKYVYTSNLLVRRDAFEAEAFSAEFTGWGWEDVEWGIRISSRYAIVHIDNPATHLGLDRASVLLDKYQNSLANFDRVLRTHPGILRTYPSYRLSRLIRRLPMRASLRRLLHRAALSNAPLLLRVVAAKLFRAAVYAEAAG